MDTLGQLFTVHAGDGVLTCRIYIHNNQLVTAHKALAELVKQELGASITMGLEDAQQALRLSLEGSL